MSEEVVGMLIVALAMAIPISVVFMIASQWAAKRTLDLKDQDHKIHLERVRAEAKMLASIAVAEALAVERARDSNETKTPVPMTPSMGPLPSPAPVEMTPSMGPLPGHAPVEMTPSMGPLPGHVQSWEPGITPPTEEELLLMEERRGY